MALKQFYLNCLAHTSYLPANEACQQKLARPAGLEPATPGLEVQRKEATRGSTTLLPLISFTFCQNPRPPDTTASRYGLSVICQSTFASRRATANSSVVGARAPRPRSRCDELRLDRQR